MFHLKKTALLATHIIIIALMHLTHLSAAEFEKNILTGNSSGTYIEFGQDISRLMMQCGQTYTAQESAGSLENLLGVRKRRNTQFGIVQSDMLSYLQTYSTGDPEIAKAIRGVRIAFPLYNEEVHLLAHKHITHLQQLSGKRVSIGPADSGTFLTSSLVLDMTNIKPKATLTLTADKALAKLLSGEIDAFFYVSGAPTPLLTSANIDPNRFHLVPIADARLQSTYTQTRLAPWTYTFQRQALDTIAVKAVLMTYDYNPQGNPYNQQSCKAVADVANQILARFSDLQSEGHPKWQHVDLTEIPPGWTISSCVNRGLAEDYSLNCPGDKQPKNAINAYYSKRICEVIGC